MMLGLICTILISAANLPSAEIIRSRQEFTLTNSESGTYYVDITIRVNDEKGKESGHFLVYTDGFETLTSFSGSVTPDSGKSQTIKKKDLVKIALSEALADDIVAIHYLPDCPYPYTVNYRYTISYRKGIIGFPPFIPVESADVALKDAEYTLSVPSGFGILYSGNISPAVTEEKHSDIYRWTAKDIEPLKEEHNMPPLAELLPFCRIAPKSFSFAGHAGSQESWESVGQWVSGLNDEVSAMPKGLEETVAGLTAEAEDDFSKVRILYDYLGRSTRYVSIQLGIGGYRPFPASDVIKTGFGDCKALSNYMKLMLDAAGIRSHYIILSTKKKNLDSGFSSVGYCNHAMLCVPLEDRKDTLWLECTSHIPLGFKHDWIAGHDVMIIDGENSHKCNVADYDGSDRSSCDSFVIKLDGKGNASISGRRTVRADIAEKYFRILQDSEKEQQEMISSGISSRAENVHLDVYKDNMDLYDGRSFVPESIIDYSFTSPSYSGSGNSNRMFLPVAPALLSQGAQKTERKHPICIEADYTREIVSTLSIPEDYMIESLPSSVDLVCECAEYSLKVETSQNENGTQVVTTQRYTIKKGRYPASDYDQFRTFSKAIKKTASSSIVLVRE